MRVARITEYLEYSGMKIFSLNLFKLNCKSQSNINTEKKINFIAFLKFLETLVNLPRGPGSHVEIKTAMHELQIIK